MEHVWMFDLSHAMRNMVITTSWDDLLQCNLGSKRSIHIILIVKLKHWQPLW